MAVGKRAKVGKERLDKYYQLAKDQGYRARSAFKLIQLAKKSDFLTNARSVIDLCGAPGGWSQVCAKNMARGSKIVCVDLCQVKPAIPGVTSIQCDITTPKCRTLLQQELGGKNAQVDLVLNDGAPNVGASWSKDAFVQNELVLHSVKLAAEFLKKGGTFVTKVFRSQDYNSLYYVFQQLFNKVEATKPQASRNVSAEIFVVCQGFKAGKIDPKMFNPKWVFMSTDDGPDEKAAKTSSASLKDLIKYQTKKHRGGYEPGDDLKILPLMDFVKSQNPAVVLTSMHKLDYDETVSGSADLKINSEWKEYCDDLRVLGKRELSQLLKWRIKLRREYAGAKREAAKANGSSGAGDKTTGVDKPDGAESSSDKPEAGSKADEELVQLMTEVTQEKKRELKKAREKKRKFEWTKKMSLGMKGVVKAEPDLFRAPRSETGLNAVNSGSGFELLALADGEQSDDEIGTGGGGGSLGLLGSRSIQVEDQNAEHDELAKLEQALEDARDALEEDDLDDILNGSQNRLERLVELEAEQCLLMRKDMDKEKKDQKRKKETRRETKYKEWGAEMESFNAELDVEAASEWKKREEISDSEDEGELPGMLPVGGVSGASGDAGEDSDGEGAGGMGWQGQDTVRRQRVGAEESGEESDDGDVGRPKEARRAMGSGLMEDEDAILRMELGKKNDGLGRKKGEATEDGAAAPGTTLLSAKDSQRAQRWFSQDVFSGIFGGRESDSEDENAADDDTEFRGTMLEDKDLPHLPLCDFKKRKIQRKKEKEREDRKKERLGTKKASDKNKDGKEEEGGSFNDGPLEVTAGRGVIDDDDDLGAPLLPGQESLRRNNKTASANNQDETPAHLIAPTDPKELCQVQALGHLMIRKKERMNLLDAGYHRYAWDDTGLGLPDWFVEDEEKCNKPELPVSKEMMDQFREKMREINARPIRKVLEANARNRKRLQQRLAKVRKEAKNLAADTEMSAGAKARNMEKMMRKAAKEGNKKQAYMAIRHGGGATGIKDKIGGKGKKAARGAGGGRTKVVDKRLKADKRGEKVAYKKALKGSKKGNRKNTKKASKIGGGGGKKGGGVKKKGKKGGKARSEKR